MYTNKRFFRWEVLNKQLQSLAAERIREHNLKFPTKEEARKKKLEGQTTYPHNYPARIKVAERNTIANCIQLYSKQAAKEINKGNKLLTNIVYANTASVRDRAAGKRVSNRHLAKAAFAGVLLGQEASKNDGKDYHFTADHSMKPLKKWHGPRKNFELLLDPTLIPLNVLPEGVEVLALSDFNKSEEVILSANMARKALHPVGKKETSINKEISIAAENQRFSISTEEGNPLVLEEGNTAKGGSSEAEIKGLGALLSENPLVEKLRGGGESSPAVTLGIAIPADLTTEISGASCTPKNGGAGSQMTEFPTHVKKSVINPLEMSFQKLYTEGKVLTAYAVMLIQMYVKKLAPAMGRTYHKTEIERGFKAAMAMLSTCDTKALNDFADRCIITIDHMEQWIQSDPDKHFVLPPSRFFDIRKPGNIKGAYQKYYLPYQAKGKEFLQKSVDRSKNQAQVDQEEMKQSDFHHIAGQIKRQMMRIHPSDTRLRAASIAKWAKDLEGIVKVDSYTIQDLVFVANWLYDNKQMERQSSRAQFWRTQAQDLGLRSASGIRRNFKELLKQAYADNHKMEMQKRSKQIPRSKRKPTTQIPTRKYNPHA